MPFRPTRNGSSGQHLGLPPSLLQDERFHQIIAIEAGHAGVWPTILAAKTQLTRLIRFSGHAGRLPVVVAEHLRIGDALDDGSIPAAEAALVERFP